MIRTTYIISALLVLVSVVFFALAETKSGTIFIPAAMGAVLALLAWIGTAESRRMHAMHAAALLTLVGIVMTAMRGVKGVLQGNTSTGAIGQTVTCALLVILLIAQVRSFIQARRNRQAGA